MQWRLNSPGMGIPAAIIMDWLLGVIDIPIYRHLGYQKTIIISTFISLIIGYIYIKLYDYCKNDWLLFEKLKSNLPITSSEENDFTKSIKKWSKLGANLIIFLYLGTRDPAVTILYFREGSYRYNGLPNLKIKILFLISSFITNLYWISIVATGFSIWKFCTR